MERSTKTNVDQLETGERWLMSDDGAGMRTWFIPGKDENFGIYTEQDVTDIVEHNKRLQNEKDVHRNSDGDWHVAAIPNVFVLKMLDDHGVNVYGDQGHVAKARQLLNSEYQFLKTTTKNI